MEALVFALITTLVQAIPKIIQTIEASKLPEAEKTKLLFDLNLALTEANVKVQSVRFKKVK